MGLWGGLYAHPLLLKGIMKFTKDNTPKFLYRLRNKKQDYEEFDTWFRSPRLAFAPLKAKYNKYKKYGATYAESYNPINFEAVEYEIKPIRTIKVNED